ncbi:ABC transporter permease [Nocardia terpenica]|uniref:ABC transporter permease n=1 Tax=Nocardia terpenica TaxID=455432 RepID=UPI001894B54E|nr:ABC transporter permease [Nocardia terpenica]MBF6061311.1 ABC transporter permease [Nocardia terpenica]MBF6105460.1 ABC transporter permease [Nocardia terpenica]MBF6113070.1 ABC transporter permease [Nocardia terpenica]MBF6119200.1 ABC transporter permease [Nocardia terpenica]MBF6152848.1 ABC transporter permease [Nocardia terpenica]
MTDHSVRARSGFRATVRALLENRLAVAGVGLVVFFLLFCFLGPLLYHTDQIGTDLANANQPPGGAHPLGTDDVGYDELGRLMAGGQASLEIGVAAAIIATVFGTLWGAVAGYVGGIVDAAMMRVVDTLLAIPTLFLLLILASIFTASVGLLIVVVSFAAWLTPARLVRGETLSLRTREYVQAVTMMGGGNRRVVLRHIMPNAIGTIVVNATFQVADAILLVAALSYLGLGIAPPHADWGNMLSNATDFVQNGYWWMILPPGVAIMLVVVGFNFLGDALRDALEVRLRRR